MPPSMMNRLAALCGLKARFHFFTVPLRSLISFPIGTAQSGSQVFLGFCGA
jgi:hypothetical protein